ncbi:MAG: class I SAM-dependent methyltransferase [Pirellulaceae bacterium]|nr:class I SAM-dependent methyltransferase [Pirellulaceae bacterium]
MKKPKSFLTELGIANEKHVQDDAKYFSLMDAAGVDLAAFEGGNPFGPEYQAALFANEKMSRWTLCRDYKRLSGVLETALHLEGLPASPRRIIDLGGGPGVVGMWYATRFPCAEVVVMDRAEAALNYGRHLATKIGLSRVSFVNASYADLANGAHGEFDIVLFHHAILFATDPLERQSSLYERYSPDMPPLAEASEAAAALASCLTPTGVAITNFSCPSYARFIDFFEALRLVGVGVDWRGTKARHKMVQDGQFALDDWTIMLRKGIPHLLADSLLDAYSLLTLGRFFGEPLSLGIAGEPIARLLGKDQPAFRFRAEYHNEPSKPEETLELLLGSGMALFRHATTKGFNRTLLTSAAASLDFFSQGTQWLEQMEASPHVRVIETHVDDSFQKLVTYYSSL